MSLKEVCGELGISLATGRNWVKLGKLVPLEGSVPPAFETERIGALKASLESGDDAALKSRRNKRYALGGGLYGSYLAPDCAGLRSVCSSLECIRREQIEITDDLMRTLLADAAVQMLSAERGACMHLKEFLAGRSGAGAAACGDAGAGAGTEFPCAKLVADLVEGVPAKECVAMYPDLFEVPYAADGGNDVLGLLYISCLSARSRKAAGAYYTPAGLVDDMVSRLQEDGLEGKRVLDPCCGTGNFLLRLPAGVPPENIYGNDIDAVAVMAARINLALKHRLQDPGVLYRNITVSDYLTEWRTERETGREAACSDGDRHMDCIIGNPPWGYGYSPEETAALGGLYRTARGSRPESYDLFIEKSLASLRPGGVMSFVLPEAVLGVQSHLAVRQVILERAEMKRIEYRGNAFSGVQCPCVVMTLKRTEHGTPAAPEAAETCAGKRAGAGEYICSGTQVTPLGGDAFVCGDRIVSAEGFCFNMNNEEYGLIRRMESLPQAQRLKGNATFALGIVTGNNKGGVSPVKTPGSEIVLKGPDLRKYRFVPPERYMAFTPEAFQQVAPEGVYRAPEKLLYRFICDSLVFAYDDRGTLSLNSCNILIPHVPGMSCKYVLALLNSRPAQFWFSRRCNSVKVLRSHLEQLPLPAADEALQREIESIVDKLRSADAWNACDARNAGAEEAPGLRMYDALDAVMAGLYGLTDAEYALVKRATDAGNLHLI